MTETTETTETIGTTDAAIAMARRDVVGQGVGRPVGQASGQAVGQAVGQDRPSSAPAGGAAGSWFKFGALTFSVVIGLALVFALAIVVAAL